MTLACCLKQTRIKVTLLLSTKNEKHLSYYHVFLYCYRPVCSHRSVMILYICLIFRKEYITRIFLKHNQTSPDMFGEVSLTYGRDKGNFRLAQSPYRESVVDFYAIGANSLGRFTISGDFRFNKIFVDSLAYGQKSVVDIWSPYHYFAAKAGEYERQNYESNFTLSYKLSKRLSPFMNVYYLSHWTTGSVDPRFDNKVFTFKYNPGVIMNFDGFNVGLKAILGRGNETQNISYKNKNYSQSLQFPDRIHYASFGYGNISIKDSLNARKYRDYLGGELTFHKSGKRMKIDLSVGYEKSKEELTTDLKATSKVYNIRGKYAEDRYKFSGLVQFPIRNSWHLLAFKGDYVTGRDGFITFSPTLNKVNYEVDLLTSQLDYMGESRHSSRWNYTYGVSIEHFNIHRKDHATLVDVTNTYARIIPKVGLNLKANEKNQIKGGLNMAYRFSLSDNLSYSENANNNYIKKCSIVGLLFLQDECFFKRAVDRVVNKDNYLTVPRRF